MRIIENKNGLYENFKQLEHLINPFLTPLLLDKTKNYKKILELCHLGKFMIHFDNKIRLLKIYEQPDFIIELANQEIGIEHEIIVNANYKNREGFFENLFRKIEVDFQKDPSMPNFLANCFIKNEATFNINQKSEIINTIKDCIQESLLKKNLKNQFILDFEDNPILEYIAISDHSQISLNANFGGWNINYISPEKIIGAILKKEKLINKYKQNNIQTQWLLMVIGSTNASSYNINTLENLEIESSFDKIYLLEDYKNILYELK